MSARNTLKNKAIRREERMARKSANPAEYSFTDIATQSAKITKVHEGEVSLNQTLKEKWNIVRPIWDLKVALGLWESRIARFLNKNSKYQPHQGKSEIARRQRQIKAGILQVSGA